MLYVSLIIIILSVDLGGIMFSNLIPKLIRNEDVSLESDDLNPGAYNAFKHCGKKIGILCLLLDFFKGFVPVFMASFFVDYNSFLFSFVILAPVLGHALGLFNHFNGGKCITTSFGVLAAIARICILPIISLALLYIFFSFVIKINSNRIKSIAVYSLLIIFALPLFTYGFKSIGVSLILISLIVIFKHSNMSKRLNKRLINS